MTSPLVISASLSAFWFAVFVALHLARAALLGRAHSAPYLAICFLGCWIAALASLALTHDILWSGPPLAWLLAISSVLLLMACAFVLYMPFVFVVSASLSVDTAITIASAKKPLTRAELLARYASDTVFLRRLDAMRAHGLLALEHGHYRLTPRGELCARFFRHLIDLWRLPQGG